VDSVADSDASFAEDFGGQRVVKQDAMPNGKNLTSQVGYIKNVQLSAE